MRGLIQGSLPDSLRKTPGRPNSDSAQLPSRVNSVARLRRLRARGAASRPLEIGPQLVRGVHVQERDNQSASDRRGNLWRTCRHERAS